MNAGSAPPRVPARRGRAENATLGRCGNIDYCSIGQQRELVSIPVGEPFVCPECAKPLRPPAPRGWQRPIVLPLLRLAVLVLGVLAGAAIGYSAGVSRHALKAANPVAAPQAQAMPQHPVPTTLSTMAKAGSRPNTRAPAAAAAPDALAPHLTAVHEHPFPRHPPPLDKADPPPVLLAEKHFGEITVDCVFASGATHPVCRASSIRGSDAFSSAATAWLQDLAPQYGPGLDHRWRMVIEDYTGEARPRP